MMNLLLNADVSRASQTNGFIAGLMLQKGWQIIGYQEQ